MTSVPRHFAPGPMRLLHVSQPVDAGVPAVVRGLVTDQVQRGHEVHVACPLSSVLTRVVPSIGGTVHRWEAGRDPGPTVLREALALGRLINRVDPTVVVLHSAKAGLAGRLAVRGRRPTVVVPHAWSFQAAAGPVASAAARWEAFASRWTAMIVCVSEAEMRRGRGVGVTAPMTVIDNGADLHAALSRSAPQARADLGLHEAPTVVCVGRLTRQKGQDLLIRAWPLVTGRVPGARLVLVGDGPASAALRAQAGDDVLFTGSREDVPALLSAADVVVVPSRWEGAALVPLEAMAASRPVVGTAVDGMDHAVGGTGAVVPVEDAAALADALARFLLDPALALAAGAAARRRMEERFDIRTSFEAWDEALRRAAGGSPRPR